MSLQNESVVYSVKLERDEARQVADAAMRRSAHKDETGKVHFDAAQTDALIWLAAETRVARLERAFNRQDDRRKGVTS
jgi:hypothetical protein